jgi:hypothetical protein
MGQPQRFWHVCCSFLKGNSCGIGGSLRGKSMGWTRALLVVASLFGGLVTALGGYRFVVEDWRSYPLGMRGVPSGWMRQSWGGAAYDFEIVADDGQPVLHLRSKGDSSTIGRDLRNQFNLREMPVLEWSWKVITLPNGAHACYGSTDDEAAQFYVAWLRFPEMVRSLIIGYVWDSTGTVGTICKSQKTPTVTYVILRSGGGESGKWITERRNVVEDFLRIYGEQPENPSALSLSIDSDDTASSAESFIGPIIFTGP